MKPNANPGLFDAVFLEPEGWCVLAPWVTTPQGLRYRPHCDTNQGPMTRGWAEYLARQLNEATKEHGR